MKKLCKFLLWWLMPGLLAAVLLPVAGCFSMLATSPVLGSGRGDLGGRVMAGALDVVTFPVQAVVFGPMILVECIDSRTGERARLREEAEARKRAKEGYLGLLREDSGKLLACPDFQCATNRAAMEAVEAWLTYDRSRLSYAQLRPYADCVLQQPDLLRRQRALWRANAFSQSELLQVVQTALKLYLSEGDDGSFAVLQDLIWNSKFTESELEAMLVGEAVADDRFARLVHRALDGQRRERLRKLEAEERARREKAEREERDRLMVEARRRALEEERRQAAAHRERMEPLIASLEEDGEAFRSALVWCRDRLVEERWTNRLYQKDPLPAANLRMLAEEVLKPGKPVRYIRGLLARSEFSSEDLRCYYGLLLARIRDDGWEDSIMSFLLRNPQTPEEVVQASYKETCLPSLLRTYIFHRLYSEIPPAALNRLQEREHELDGDRKLSPERRRLLLEKEYRRLLPKECPADWVKFI